MLVGYDVPAPGRVGFSLYTTHDGEAILRGMGFQDVFTMNAGAQGRLLDHTTNSEYYGLFIGNGRGTAGDRAPPLVMRHARSKPGLNSPQGRYE